MGLWLYLSVLITHLKQCTSILFIARLEGIFGTQIRSLTKVILYMQIRLGNRCPPKLEKNNHAWILTAWPVRHENCF